MRLDPAGFGPEDHGTLVTGIVVGDGTSGTRTGVAPGATIVPIRVEMPGHEPFLDTVVPSKDVTVQVTLVPMPHGDASAPSAEGRDAPSPPGKGPKRNPGGLEKSGRDTYYTEKFE